MTDMNKAREVAQRLRDYDGIKDHECVYAGVEVIYCLVAEVERLTVQLDSMQRHESTLEDKDREIEKLKALVRDSFTEGYFSCTTYNDVETSDCDTQWEKSDVAAKVKGNI